MFIGKMTNVVSLYYNPDPTFSSTKPCSDSDEGECICAVAAECTNSDGTKINSAACKCGGGILCAGEQFCFAVSGRTKQPN